MNEKFFGIRFWQHLLVASISSLVVLIISAVAALYIGSQLQQIQDVSDSINRTMQTVLQLVEAGPEGINAVSSAIVDNAVNTGESVGDGAATVVNRVGNALERFRNPSE